MASWDVSKSFLFWSKREFKTLIRDENLADKHEIMQSQRQSRNDLTLLHKKEFGQKFNDLLKSVHSVSIRHPLVAQNLQFWIEHLSWTYCKNCKLLKTDRLLPNYFKRPTVKFSKNCTCTNKVYINPSVDKFPEVVQGLSLNEIIVLRPSKIHLGDYVKNKMATDKKLISSDYLGLNKL